MTHTTSLSLSKELYEKGLKIETEKCHAFNDKGQHRIVSYIAPDLTGIDEPIHFMRAYSTDELLAVMPYQIIAPDEYEYKLFIIKRKNNYGIKYLDEQGQGILLQLNGSYAYSSEIELPEALGLMIKWLLDNGHHFNGKELVR